MGPAGESSAESPGEGILGLLRGWQRSRLGGVATTSDLRESLSISAPELDRELRSLESRGLVICAPAPPQGAAQVVALTDHRPPPLTHRPAHRRNHTKGERPCTD